MVKIAIAGCSGRMGKMLLREVIATKDCELAAGSVTTESEAGGKDLGVIAGVSPVGIKAISRAEDLVSAAEVVIDFTVPDLTLQLARICADKQKPLVTGTTGINAASQREIEELAQKTAIVQSGNMSPGINILLGLVERTAAMLDDSYDIEIMEMHHRHKRDAPSGTALMLGESAAAGRGGLSLTEVKVAARDGITGERPRGAIGFSSLRGGDVIGEHKVIFAAAGERIEIAHKASDRKIFASGAVRAALWVKDKKAGLYNMRDVMGL